MAFRADEVRGNGYEKAKNYLVSQSISIDERPRSLKELSDIITKFGPVIDYYPRWHPLVSHGPNDGFPRTQPNQDTGYYGLDHTVYFTNAFLTCPYGCRSQEVIDAVNELPTNPDAHISAELLDVQFYHPNSMPILVKCDWLTPLPSDNMIPKELAVPLLIERELPNWRSAEVGETWKTMSSGFLGCPHGALSSLFVNQETGQAMKNTWSTLINSGMFGPIMV